MTVGILVWAYTLLLPSFADAGLVGKDILDARPVRHRLAAAAAPARARSAAAGRTACCGASRSTCIAYVTFSLARAPSAIERLQANVFVPAEARADDAELPALALVGDGRGADRHGRALSRRGAHLARRSRASRRAGASASIRSQEADIQLLRYAEHILASAIGAASSRLVLSLLLRKRTVSTKAALKLLDDANAAIQYNREILQTALDHVRQGIAVFDKELQLVCWNRQFGEILDLPPSLTRVGIGLDEILRHNAEQGALGPGAVEDLVHDRITRYSRAASRSASASPSADW